MDQPLAAFAKTVVHDKPNEVAVFVRPGDPVKVHNAVRGGTAQHKHRPIVALRDGWLDKTWSGFRLLTLKRPGDEHSISLSWSGETGTFDHWYIDLTSPLRRTRAGFDLLENGLDIVVDPDMQSWQWKDEDELEWAVEHGTYTRAEADALYAEGESAVSRLVRERARFERWVDWRPDPTWPQAALPDDWDAV